MIGRFLYWLTFSALIIGNFIFLWHLTADYGGTDLRCRIVGSRLLTSGKSSYFYKWNPEDGERLLDPNDVPDRQVNGNVCTPALLALNIPISHFSYNYVRIAWTVLQFALLTGSCLLLYFSGKKNGRTRGALVAVSVIFLFSNTWSYNIERGQTYILYTFIFSLCYFIYSSKLKNKYFATGAVLGIGIWIRPLLLLASVPFLLNRNYKGLLGGLFGVLMGFLIFFVPFRKQWSDYSSAMKIYEAEVLGKAGHFSSDRPLNKPEVIEDVANITHYMQDFNAGGLATFQQYLQHYLSKYGIASNSFVSMGILAVIIGLCSLFYFKKRAFGFDDRPELLFSIAFLFYMLSELFIVGSRGGYNCIQWLFPAFIIAANTKKRFLIGLLVMGIACMNGEPVTFRFQYPIGEMGMFAALLIFIAEQIGFAKKPQRFS